MTASVRTLDPARVRELFPGLARRQGGRPCVFADAPGGTQVPRSVIRAMAGYLERTNSNTDGAFATSAETDATIDRARRAAADFVGADPDEVVFGPEHDHPVVRAGPVADPPAPARRRGRRHPAGP
ncbi:MAG TPA: aminotransferase class V-fold PLP-dependent enzyme [Actinomycetota bacterium]|nr:aminotransferase class V-fold PLP-dependent enzyme [Actinomycetota bacterium]